MRKRLTRKLVTLFVLVVALTAASAAAVRAEPVCWFCVEENGRMVCVRVVCPEN